MQAVPGRACFWVIDCALQVNVEAQQADPGCGWQGRQAPHAAISAAGCPPFIAWEECREHLGRHPCDQRRALRHYKSAFPAVDFSLVRPCYLCSILRLHS